MCQSHLFSCLVCSFLRFSYYNYHNGGANAGDNTRKKFIFESVVEILFFPSFYCVIFFFHDFVYF